LRTITLAIAGLLLISGCSSDPKPIEPKKSTGHGPQVSSPTLPAKAKADTPEGAAEFVRFWVDAFNHAASTGDATAMATHAKRCKPCLEYADDFEKLKASERPDGPAWTLERVSVVLRRDPIEVKTTVGIRGENRHSPLTFVLNSHAPFEVVNIYRRSNS
jgi:hypothetical protein